MRGRRKALMTVGIGLYGAIGGWLVYATAVPKDTGDLPSWLGPVAHGVLFVLYGAGAFMLRRAIMSGSCRRAILVPLLFPPAALTVVVVMLVVLGGRF